MANTFKFGNKNWAWKEDYVLAYNDENNNFKPLPFDFTRSSSATRVNSSGLVEIVGSGEPRVDYLNNADGHLLLEPSRTNLFPYSEAFSDSSWSKNAGTTITDNYAISPDGTQNASRYLGTGTSGINYKTQLPVSSHTVSFWVKSNNGQNQFCRLLGDSSNISNNILVTTEWSKIEYTFTGSNLTNKANGIIRDSSDNDIDILIYGAQLEQGSYATSYIPTEGSSVTRAADDAANGGNSQVFDNDSAVWFIDCERIGVEGGRAIALENGSGTEQLRLHLDSPTALGRFRDALASFATIGSQFTATAGLRIKAALKINGATLSVFVNGSKVGSDYTRPTAFDIQKMHIYGEAFKVNDIKFYNTALSDSELQALTT